MKSMESVWSVTIILQKGKLNINRRHYRPRLYCDLWILNDNDLKRFSRKISPLKYTRRCIGKKNVCTSNFIV